MTESISNQPAEQSPDSWSLADPELLNRVRTYFGLIDNPDTDLTPEQATEVARLYFIENIRRQYTDPEINAAMWLYR